MRELDKDKRGLHEIYLRTKSENDKTEYNRKNREEKYKVQEKKCILDERLGECLSRILEKKKLF